MRGKRENWGCKKEREGQTVLSGRFSKFKRIGENEKRLFDIK